MAFNFGSTPTFGATTTATTTPSFGFGTATTTAAKTLGFGTSSFSLGGTTTTTTTAAPTFSLGTSTATTSTGFSLGGLSTPAATTGGFSLGSFGTVTATTTTTTTTATGFGFGTGASTTTAATGFPTLAAVAATTTTGFSFGFGQTQPTATTAGSLFSAFGQPQTTNTGFGLFGANKPLGTATPSTGLGLGGPQQFGQGLGMQQQQQQQQIQQGVPGLDPIYNSVFNCCMFGDERDEVLSKWNLLQACWGSGKGYYSPNMPPVEYNPQNPLCRFKAIVYSIRPTENKEGLIVIQFSKKEEEIKSQEQQLISSLSSILGNKPNLTVHVDSVKPVNDTSSLVFICVEEKAPNGQTRRVANVELNNYFLQPTPKQQLTNMGVVDMYAFTPLNPSQIQEYLDNAPAGVDPRLWKQAQLDNPDPDKYMPVPLLGFTEVKWRYLCQMEETKRHKAFLDRLGEDIASLERDNEAARLKILEYRHKVVDLEHRVLKVLVRQEVTRNLGVALRPEEEMLKSQFDAIHSQLNSPQFRGRLSELLSQIRMHKQEASQQGSDSYNMSLSMQDEIKQFLEMETLGIKSVVDMVKGDTDDVKIIKEDLGKMSLNPGKV